MVSWIVSAYTITVAATSLPFGKLADEIGRRPVFLAGITLFGAASLASAFSLNIWMMIICRIAQGLGAAMIFATNNAILIRAFPIEIQGKMLGQSVAATYVGLSIGPVVGGVLNNNFGWKSIYLVITVIAGVSLAFSMSNVPDDWRKPMEPEVARHPDFVGILLYATAIFLSLYGLNNFKVSNMAKGMFLVGAIMIAVFFIYESKNDNPVFKTSLLQVAEPLLFRTSHHF